jgi:hypothetical protein
MGNGQKSKIKLSNSRYKPIFGFPLRKDMKIPKAELGISKIVKWNSKEIQREIDKSRRKRR